MTHDPEPDPLGFSEQEGLLLAAVAPRRFPLRPGSDLGGLLSPDLFALASKNRVGAFLWHLVVGSDVKPGLDSETRNKARTALADALLLGLKLDREVKAVGEVLGAAGVRAMIYKGPDIADRCYERACPRLFGDLDLIVEPGQVERAAKALEEAGYGPMPAHGPPLSYFRRFHLHATFSRPGRILPVELHWALDSPYSDRIDVLPMIFDNAELADRFGSAFVRPSTIDCFALMAMHADKHLALQATLPTATGRLKSVIDAGGLIWLLDMAHWLERYGPRFDGEAVLDRMRRLGFEAELITSLRLTADLAGEALPDWAVEQAERCPCRPLWIHRLLYPDLARGRDPSPSSNPSGRHRRSRWLDPLPILGFRPIRLLQALLPGPRIAGARVPKAHRAPIRVVRWLALAVANGFAVMAWKLRVVASGRQQVE